MAGTLPARYAESASIYRSASVMSARNTVAMVEERPLTDERDPADVVTGMVDHVLALVDESSYYADAVGDLS
jgi:hypothetical protein